MWPSETADGRAAVYDDGHLIELAHPEICRRLDITLTAPLPELADTTLSLLEEHLDDRVPAFSAVRPGCRVCD